MPNWCGNQTTVSGPSQDLDDFFQRIVNPTAFSTEVEVEKHSDAPTIAVFDRLLPVPENGYKKTVVNEGADNERTCSVFAQPAVDGDEYIDGYAWCVNNWGTKWGDCDTSYELFPEWNNLVLTYTTAWGPAGAGWINVSKLFPKLSFLTTYEEEGNGFVGAFSVVDGEVCHDDIATSGDGRYPEQPEDLHERDDGGDGYFQWLTETHDLRDRMATEAEEALLYYRA